VSKNPAVIKAPTNLSGKGAKGSATLSWTDNSNNETGFYIERAPSGSTNFARIGSVAANVKTFQDHPSRGSYVYRVQAFNATAASGYSNTASVSVK